MSSCSETPVDGLAIGAFTGLDTVMGQAQNPLSLNRYLGGLK